MSALNPPTSIAFKRYVELLDALLLERAVHGTLNEDVEERFVVAMNDCRQSMTPEGVTLRRNQLTPPASLLSVLSGAGSTCRVRTRGVRSTPNPRCRPVPRARGRVCCRRLRPPALWRAVASVNGGRMSVGDGILRIAGTVGTYRSSGPRYGLPSGSLPSSLRA